MWVQSIIKQAVDVRLGWCGRVVSRVRSPGHALCPQTDKVSIIKMSPDLGGEKGQFVSDLARIQLLRDNLAHANDYAAARDAASQVCQTVRSMDTWIKRLGKEVS
jgi:hypothetical protein